MIRVLIADDSATARRHLAELLRRDPEIQVIGEAHDGSEAVALTQRLRPDLVTLDMRMPRMDGFEATREIMTTAPTPIVILTASTSARDVANSLRALQAGAVTLMPKPPGIHAPNFHESAMQLLGAMKAMARVKVVRQHRQGSRAARPVVTWSSRCGTPGRIVAIAASTGGPAALQHLLATLPRDFTAPILVVQHITQGFIHGLAEWLRSVCTLHVKVAEHGEALATRTVYLGPEDQHIGVTSRGTIELSGDLPIDGFRPSGTYLFNSVARSYGSSVVAVILTGMGSDGVEGSRTVRSAGGCVIAQDESSSIVYGMPGAAVAAGIPHLVLPLEAIASRLRAIVGMDGVERDSEDRAIAHGPAVGRSHDTIAASRGTGAWERPDVTATTN